MFFFLGVVWKFQTQHLKAEMSYFLEKKFLDPSEYSTGLKLATNFTCGLKIGQNDIPKSPKIVFFYIFARHMLHDTFKINVNHLGKFLDTLLNFFEILGPLRIFYRPQIGHKSHLWAENWPKWHPKIAKNRVILHFWTAYASWYLQNQCKLSWKVFRDYFEFFGILNLT